MGISGRSMARAVVLIAAVAVCLAVASPDVNSLEDSNVNSLVSLLQEWAPDEVAGTKAQEATEVAGAKAQEATALLRNLNEQLEAADDRGEAPVEKEAADDRGEAPVEKEADTDRDDAPAEKQRANDRDDAPAEKQRANDRDDAEDESIATQHEKAANTPHQALASKASNPESEEEKTKTKLRRQLHNRNDKIQNRNAKIQMMKKDVDHLLNKKLAHQVKKKKTRAQRREAAQDVAKLSIEQLEDMDNLLRARIKTDDSVIKGMHNDAIEKMSVNELVAADTKLHRALDQIKGQVKGQQPSATPVANS